MKVKILLLVVGMLIFSVSFVSAGLCQDTGCPLEWCDTFGDNIICDGSSSSIDITDDMFFCEEDGMYWINTEGSYPIKQEEQEGLSCYQEEVAVGSGNTCCPPGSVCDIGTGFVGEEGVDGICWVVAGLDSCFNYLNAEDCNSDTGNVGTRTVEEIRGSGFCSQVFEWNNGDEDCFNTIICGCSWDEAEDVCSAKWTNDSVNCEFSEGGCIETFISEDKSGCDMPNGNAVFTFESEPWGSYIGLEPNPCEGGTYDVLCSELTRLPFFGFFNIVSVLTILFVFYYFRLEKV